jgi:hypothetical protein
MHGDCGNHQLLLSLCSSDRRHLRHSLELVEWVDCVVYAARRLPEGTVAGVVQVSAQNGGLPLLLPLSYTVAPGLQPERMFEFSPVVRDRSSFRVSGVQVDVVPDRGSPQTCTTDQFGSCPDYSIWVLKGNVRVRLTKVGYQTIETTVSPPTDNTFLWPAGFQMQSG